eukprot:364644-Chlamydomonas_euryale.AAC.3
MHAHIQHMQHMPVPRSKQSRPCGLMPLCCRSWREACGTDLQNCRAHGVHFWYGSAVLPDSWGAPVVQSCIIARLMGCICGTDLQTCQTRWLHLWYRSADLPHAVHLWYRAADLPGSRGPGVVQETGRMAEEYGGSPGQGAGYSLAQA